MNKKYRVKINYSEITEKNISIAYHLKRHGLDGKIAEVSETGDCFIFNNHTRINKSNVPETWVIEIEKTLLTKDESWGNYSIEAFPIADKNSFNAGWDARTEKYKLEQNLKKDNECLITAKDFVGDGQNFHKEFTAKYIKNLDNHE